MPEKKAPDPKACWKLDKVWSPSIHKVSGTQYWLDRAFTLDDNHDGAVDNVGFILKAEDKPELYIYYFPGKGRQSVVTVPTLRLKDDRKVLEVCFGQAKFEKFKPVEKKPKVTFQVPNLAEELAAKSEGKKDEATPKAGENGFLDGPGLFFAIAIGAGVLLLGGGGVGYALARRRAERRRKKRRTGERRQRDDPIDGEDRRDGKNRRQDGARRGDAKRRDKDDRRQRDRRA